MGSADPELGLRTVSNLGSADPDFQLRTGANMGPTDWKFGRRIGSNMSSGDAEFRITTVTRGRQIPRSEYELSPTRVP